MPGYSRNCPTCNTVLNYSSYKNLWRANNRNVSCAECTRQFPKKLKTSNYSRNCVMCNKQILYSSIETLKKAKNKKCNSCAQKSLSISRFHTEETKQKISKNHSKYWLGKKRPMREDSKTKLRLSTINFIQKTKGKCSPRYNPTACEIFEKINSMFGWNGIHAERGGEHYIKELGYWVDYYEPKLNLVIEYDERQHNRKIQKDLIRQNQIQTFLNCKFIRVKETDSLNNIVTKLKEVL